MPQGGDVKDTPVSPKDVLATTFHLLGIDPHTMVTDPQGRPLADRRRRRGEERIVGVKLRSKRKREPGTFAAGKLQQLGTQGNVFDRQADALEQRDSVRPPSTC